MRNEMDFCTFLAYWLEFSVSQATMNLSRNLVPVKSYYAVPWDICHVGRDVNTGFWLSPGEIGCKETEPQTSWCFGFFSSSCWSAKTRQLLAERYRILRSGTNLNWKRFAFKVKAAANMCTVFATCWGMYIFPKRQAGPRGEKGHRIVCRPVWVGL